MTRGMAMVRSTMAILAPGPVGTDRSRKMMQIAPTDAPKSCFWSQNRLRNIFGHLGGNLAPEVQTVFFRDHVAGWTGGKNTTWKEIVRLGSAFLAGAFVFWDNTTWKNVVRLGSAFLAGAFVFWENTTWKKVVRLGSAFLAGAFDFWEKHEPWLLLPYYSMTMEIAKMLRAPRHAPTQVAKA